MSPSTVQKRNGAEKSDAVTPNGRQNPPVLTGALHAKDPRSASRGPGHRTKDARTETARSHESTVGPKSRRDGPQSITTGQSLAVPSPAISEHAPRASQTPSSERPRSRRSAADGQPRPSPSITSRQTSPVSSLGGPELDSTGQADEGLSSRRRLRRQRSPSTDAAPTPESRANDPPPARRSLQADGRLASGKRAREAKRIKIRYATALTLDGDREAD